MVKRLRLELSCEPVEGALNDELIKSTLQVLANKDFDEGITLEANDGTFIQAARNDGLCLEYFGESGKLELQVEGGLTLETVTNVFVLFANHDETWKTAVTWQRLSNINEPQAQVSDVNDPTNSQTTGRIYFIALLSLVCIVATIQWFAFPATRAYMTPIFINVLFGVVLVTLALVVSNFLLFELRPKIRDFIGNKFNVTIIDRYRGSWSIVEKGHFGLDVIIFFLDMVITVPFASIPFLTAVFIYMMTSDGITLLVNSLLASM